MTVLLTFLANAAWQLPLLAAACALLVRIARPAQHNAYRLWLLALGLGVALPFAGALRVAGVVRAMHLEQRSLARAGSQAAPGRTAPQQARMLPNLSLAFAVLSGAQAPAYAPEAQKPAPGAFAHGIAPTVSHVPVLHRLAVLWAHSARAAAHVAYRRFALPRWAARSMAALWLACCAWALVRLLLRRRATLVLVAEAQPLALPPAMLAAYRQCARNFHITAPPVAGSAHTGPALAGLLHPVLLLPADFIDNSTAEQQAAFAHELAHLSRRDPWTQLLAECLVTPLRWHPASAWVLREIDRTRELATDRLAARHLASPQDYATSLLSLAQSMLPRAGQAPFALGLFPNPSRPTLLEQRIMQLMQPAITLPLRRRIPAALAGCLLAGTVAAWAAASPVTLTAAAQSTPAPAAQGATPPVPSTPAPAPAPFAAPAPAAAPAPSDPAPAAVEPVSPGPPLPADAALPAQLSVPPDRPAAVAHGPSASVVTAPGEYVHRWTGRDGQPWVATTRDSAPLTVEQERAIEERTRKLLASIDTAKIQKQVEQSTAYLRSPEFQKQMAEAGKIDTEKLQHQVNQSTLYLRSPEFQRQMAEAGRIDGEKLKQQIDQSTAYLRSSEFQKQMQLRMQSTVQMQAQIAALQAKVAALEQQLAAQRSSH